MDQAVARETEEAKSQEELPESELSLDMESLECLSTDSGSEMEEEGEDEEEDEDEEEEESEPDHIIFQLVREGNLEAVSEIVRSDRTAVHQRDCEHHTPIHETSTMGGGQSLALDMAKLLLSYGAPVNSQASESYTPLHIACVTGQEKICNLLLTNGARYDLRVEDSWETPLELARNSILGKKREIAIVKTFRR